MNTETTRVGNVLGRCEEAKERESERIFFTLHFPSWESISRISIFLINFPPCSYQNISPMFSTLGPLCMALQMELCNIKDVSRHMSSDLQKQTSVLLRELMLLCMLVCWNKEPKLDWGFCCRDCGTCTQIKVSVSVFCGTLALVETWCRIWM